MACAVSESENWHAAPLSKRIQRGHRVRHGCVRQMQQTGQRFMAVQQHWALILRVWAEGRVPGARRVSEVTNYVISFFINTKNSILKRLLSPRGRAQRHAEKTSGDSLPDYLPIILLFTKFIRAKIIMKRY